MTTLDRLIPSGITTSITAAKFLWNKGVVILILTFLVYCWFASRDGTSPLSELLCAGILTCGVLIGAPLMRLLVFPEAAQYAESGALRLDIGLAPRLPGEIRPPARFTPALTHYWFATAVCHLTAIVAAVTLRWAGA